MNANVPEGTVFWAPKMVVMEHTSTIDMGKMGFPAKITMFADGSWEITPLTPDGPRKAAERLYAAVGALPPWSTPR